MRNSINKTLFAERSAENVRELWYDWFCRDSSLYNKGLKLLDKLEQISYSAKFDANKTYVFFKNNCPLSGSLYDDFRICDIETGDVIFTVVPKCGHTCMNGKGEVWGRENNFQEPLVVGTWRDIKKWFNS